MSDGARTAVGVAYSVASDVQDRFSQATPDTIGVNSSIASQVQHSSDSSFQDQLIAALSGLSVQFDPEGVVRMVNKSNLKRGRRG